MRPSLRVWPLDPVFEPSKKDWEASSLSSRGVIRLDVFGRRVELARSDDKWKAFYLGSEGKKRPACHRRSQGRSLNDVLPTFVTSGYPKDILL